MTIPGDLVAALQVVPELTGKVYRDQIPADIEPPFARVVRIARGPSLRGSDGDVTTRHSIQIDIFQLGDDDALIDAVYAALSDVTTSGTPARLDHSVHTFDIETGLSQDVFTLEVDSWAP